MSEQIDTSTVGAIVASIIAAASGWIKVLHMGRVAKQASDDHAEGEDKAYLRKMVDGLTADIRQLLAAAQRDAADARNEAAALRERVRLLEERVDQLETENDQLRADARRRIG